MKKLKSQSGVAAIEMAVATPLIILMLMGTIDFGRVYYTAVTVSNAARAGVSYGALDPSHADNLEKMEEVAESEARNISPDKVVAENFCECKDGSTADCEDDDSCKDGSMRVFVKVTVQKTFKTIVGYPGIPETVTLTRDAIMRAE